MHWLLNLITCLGHANAQRRSYYRRSHNSSNGRRSCRRGP